SKYSVKTSHHRQPSSTSQDRHHTSGSCDPTPPKIIGLVQATPKPGNCTRPTKHGYCACPAGITSPSGQFSRINSATSSECNNSSNFWIASLSSWELFHARILAYGESSTASTINASST